MEDIWKGVCVHSVTGACSGASRKRGCLLVSYGSWLPLPENELLYIKQTPLSQDNLTRYVYLAKPASTRCGGACLPSKAAHSLMLYMFEFSHTNVTLVARRGLEQV